MLERGRGGVTQMGTTGDGRDLQHNYSDHHHQPSPAQPSTGHTVVDTSSETTFTFHNTATHQL